MTLASKHPLALALALALLAGCSDSLTTTTDSLGGDDDSRSAQETPADDDSDDGSQDDGPSVLDAGRAGSSRDGGSASRTPDASTPSDDAPSDGADSDAGDDPPASGGGRTLPPVTSVDGNGPFAVTIDQNVGPNRGWVVRPTDLGKDGIKHPIFIWGAGAGTNASNYRDHLSRWASHGFVIEGHASTGSARDHKGALDWLVAENGRQGSPYYQKLDVSKVAFGGHSQGSISTFAASDDARITTTIHVAGGSFDGMGGGKLKKPTAYLCGQTDTSATNNANRDYTGTKVPVFMTVMNGINHIYAAREGLPASTAWLRWWLAGETERKEQFIGASCEYCKGKYVSKSKNW
ncbi:MAG: hypothetical protein ABW252_09610 [Polyangiales bacterium]